MRRHDYGTTDSISSASHAVMPDIHHLAFLRLLDTMINQVLRNNQGARYQACLWAPRARLGVLQQMYTFSVRVGLTFLRDLLILSIKQI